MKRLTVLLVPLLLLALLGVASCGGGIGGSEEEKTTVPTVPDFERWLNMPTLSVSSTAFRQGWTIPVKYTCDGVDISPPLQWGDVPAGTQSFILILDDPDAPGGTRVHWVLYNIPGGTSALSEDIPPDTELPDGSRHGKNSWGELGYRGPCPSSGTHRYVFNLYALDTVLDLPDGVTCEQLYQAMDEHIIAAGVVMGVYSRG